MFSAQHRRTVQDLSDSALLQGDSLPQVIVSEDNPPLDMFVRHGEDSDYEESDILHPARHNALHWMGKPISYDVDEDLDDPF